MVPDIDFAPAGRECPPQEIVSAAGGGEMIERSAVSADWLTGLSERLRADGDIERADRVLLLAWQAYDGQDITPDMLVDDRSIREIGSGPPARHHSQPLAV